MENEETCKYNKMPQFGGFLRLALLYSQISVTSRKTTSNVHGEKINMPFRQVCALIVR